MTGWRKYATWQFTRKVLYRTVIIYSCAYAFGKHVGELVICSGPSMHPTIEDGDLVLAERLSIANGTVRRGDIIGCVNPHDHTQLLCKRLFAKERDRVPPSEHLPDGRIPLGHVYLRGDNSAASTDSRHFGPVPEGFGMFLHRKLAPLMLMGSCRFDFPYAYGRQVERVGFPRTGSMSKRSFL